MADIDPQRKLARKRRGNRLGFWFFDVLLKRFGLKGAYGLLTFVCFYYLLFDRAAVKAAMAYIQRRFPDYGPLKKQLAVYKLFVSQGKNLIDRQLLVSGQGAFEIEFNGYDRIEELVKDPRQGFILLTSHMGNWQTVMSTIGNLEKPVCLLMGNEHNRAVEASLKMRHADKQIQIISPEGFLGGVVEVVNFLRQGYVVAIMGDRSYGYNATHVAFLGDQAQFSYGGFSIAAAVGCPVVVLLPAKVATKKYRIDVARVFRPKITRERTKKDWLNHWTQEFARILEAYVERYPFQCFLFFDIWDQAESGLSAKGGSASGGDSAGGKGEKDD